MTVVAALATAVKLARRAKKIAAEAEELHEVLHALPDDQTHPCLLYTSPSPRDS